MSQRSHLTDSEAWRVVDGLEGGQTQAEVAQAIGVSQSVISRIWNRFLETGSAGRRPGQVRRRATTPNEDHYLVLMALRHRNMNATLLQQHLRSATGTTVSTQTVRNRLHGVGLYAVCSPIDDLYIIRGGPLTARRYRDEILRPIVVPYNAAIGDDFILMDHNSRPHRANLVEDSLFEEGIVRMEWPACSPDMNPIEHVWDALGRRVGGRQPPQQTVQELKRALLEGWDRIPQLVINSLCDSMPQRDLTKALISSLPCDINTTLHLSNQIPLVCLSVSSLDSSWLFWLRSSSVDTFFSRKIYLSSDKFLQILTMAINDVVVNVNECM
ncbi:transposable element Tcb2 transposase [Trichonephila clavipes]|nr:transposable element Tcb2 transposase [Trichonephila clavipes]